MKQVLIADDAVLTAPEAIEARKVEPAAVDLLPRRPDPRVVAAIMRKNLAEVRARLRWARRARRAGKAAHAAVTRR